MFYLNGLGWITEKEFGSHHGKIGELDSPLKIPNPKSIIELNYENWRRIDLESKRTCLAIGLSYGSNKITIDKNKTNIGIIGYGVKGSITSDIKYWDDYLKHNKQSARGNLFTYTLSTIPLSESAIFYQFNGPILFIQHNKNPLQEAIQTAKIYLLNSNLKEIFIGCYEKDCLFLRIGKETDFSICNLKETLNYKSQKVLIKQIINLQKKISK